MAHTTTSILEGHTHTLWRIKELVAASQEWSQWLLQPLQEREAYRLSLKAPPVSVCVSTHIFTYRWKHVCVQILHACKPNLYLAVKWIIQQEYYMWSEKQRKWTAFKGEWKSKTWRGDHNSPSQKTDPDLLNKILFPHPLLSRVSPARLHLFARETTLAAVRLIGLSGGDNFIHLQPPPLAGPEPSVTAGDWCYAYWT